MALLEMSDICKRFSSVLANDCVSLRVDKGEIHALLGENGAGKTTLMNILFGIYQADSGTIRWKGRDVSFPNPSDAIAAGIEMVHQHFSLVSKMTVAQNIILGLKQPSPVVDYKAVSADILALSEQYGLQVDPAAKVRDLSVGEQQRVEILKALYRKADLLILDEPTGVLTPQETEHFFAVLRRLKAEGYAIIIITHRISEILAISDRVTILRDGRNAASLVTTQTDASELARHMIGRALRESYDREPYTGPKEAIVTLSGVGLSRKGTSKPLLSDLCLELFSHEVLGIAGVDGNGQKELTEVIMGIRRHTSGAIYMLGDDIGTMPIYKRYQKGISFISDDRHTDSLVIDMALSDNLILRGYREAPYARAGLLNRSAIQRQAEEMIARYEIKAPGGGALVRLLSGGNQQKIILARELSCNPRLVIANQPTRGLDIGATEHIRQLLTNERNKGNSVLLVSADLEEIMALSDRIAVMYDGRIVGLLPQGEATTERLGLLMSGQQEVVSA